VSTRSSPTSSANARAANARRIAAVGVVGAALGGALLLPHLAHAHALIGHLRGTPYVTGFDSLDHPLEVLFALGDGQSFVALARDPTLSNLTQFRGARGQAALRADRPLQGYLGWVFSAGNPTAAEGGVVAASLFGAGLAAAGCGELLRRRGRSPWLGLLVLILPSAIAGLRAFGPEFVGLGFVCFGLAMKDERKTWAAVLFFALAGLSRETYLLVPLLFAFKERRYLIPIATWLAWTGIVWLRFGAWGPTVTLDGTRLLVPPLFGFTHALHELQSPVATILCMVAIPVAVIATLDRRRHDPLTRIVVAYGLFSIFFDWVVWVFWASFTRTLLPLFAFSLIALAGKNTVELSPVVETGGLDPLPS